MFRLGLIVNPLAGLGGPAALKGSDAQDTACIAAERGVYSRIPERLAAFFSQLQPHRDQIQILTVSGQMGEAQVLDNGWTARIVSRSSESTSAEDTRNAAQALMQTGVDLLIFVGGDGTARDVCQVVGDRQAVLGLPAGVKMHSGVFAVTPMAAASVVQSLLRGRLVAARLAEVRDIDEAAFRAGKVRTAWYGDMLIPDDQLLVQCVKCSGLPDDEAQLEELSAWLLETMQPDVLYVLGSGGTLHHLKQALGLPEPTLLGVDLWHNGQQVGADVFEQNLFDTVCHYPKVSILLSVIGGQGVVLGRGNQQVSPRVIRAAGLASLHFIATHKRLEALGGRPLLLDSGDDMLDRELSGFRQVLCGYEDALLYEFRYLDCQSE